MMSEWEFDNTSTSTSSVGLTEPYGWCKYYNVACRNANLRGNCKFTGCTNLPVLNNQHYQIKEPKMSECQRCGHYDEDWGCTCPSQDKWYSCPIESVKPENQEKLLRMIKDQDIQENKKFEALLSSTLENLYNRYWEDMYTLENTISKKCRLIGSGFHEGTEEYDREISILFVLLYMRFLCGDMKEYDLIMEAAESVEKATDKILEFRNKK